MGRTMFDVWCSIVQGPKIGCSSSITKRWTRSRQFNVRKNDVLVCSMINSLILVKAFYIWCLTSVRWKPKFRCLISIINRWTHSSMFDVRKIMFAFVRCSLKWFLSHHYFFGHDCSCSISWWWRCSKQFSSSYPKNASKDDVIKEDTALCLRSK